MIMMGLVLHLNQWVSNYCMMIDLDIPHQPALEEVQAQLYLKEITFQLTPDEQLLSKLQKIDRFVPFLSHNPLIKTSFKTLPNINYGPTYAVVSVGGTFDNMHLGHQVLLLFTALSATQRIYIGVSGNALLKNKKWKELLQPIEVRMKRIEAFIKEIKPSLETIIFELKDPYGVTITEPNMDALIVSEETRKGGDSVNEARVQIGMRPLTIITAPTISPSNDVKGKISSSTIRAYLLAKNELSIEEYKEYKAAFDSLGSRLEASRTKMEYWWQILFLNYSEHWRYYHTNQHIFRLLQEWKGKEFVQRRQKLTPRDINVVQIAIFFHDIIYRPDSNSNQEDSAKLAVDFIKEIVTDKKQAEDLLAEVRLLILQTKAHQPSNELSSILYDLDMGILNSHFQHYQKYAKAIRQEYEPLVGKQYCKKRAQLLSKWKQSKFYFKGKTDNLLNNLNWQIQELQNSDL